MTAPESDVFFDTWAWWEIVANTVRGRRLHARYLHGGRIRVHTSVLNLAELSVKFEDDPAGRGPKSVALVEGLATVHPINRDVSLAGAKLRRELRRSHPAAGLVDALILATSRSLRIPLISADAAFGRQPDVRDH